MTMLAVATAESVAFITGTATVLAAVVLGGWAAKAANDRLDKQIADAGKRQERELAHAVDTQRLALDAEAARQDAALRSARELADIADLRALLDEAARLVHDAGDGLHKLSVRFSEDGAALSKTDRDAAGVVGTALTAAASRLLVRVGHQTKLAETFQACCLAIWNAWSAVGHLEDAPSLVDVRRTLAASQEAYQASADAFILAAVERVGTM